MEVIKRELRIFKICCGKIDYPDYKAEAIIKILLEELEKDFLHTCTESDEFYYFRGNLHRDDDLPAVIYSDGTKEWWRHGERHRDNDLPAVEFANWREWWTFGNLNRTNDLPAIEHDDLKEWWQNGKMHRDQDFPAFVMYENGIVQQEEWWKEGVRHREDDKPASITYEDGEIYLEEWWIDGMRHREGMLPAFQTTYGEQRWYKNGKRYLFQKKRPAKKRKINPN